MTAPISSYVGGGLHMQHGNLVIISKLKGGKEVYDAQQHFAFHRVSNFKAYTWSAEERKFHWKLTFPGQYDIAKHLGSFFCSAVRELTLLCISTYASASVSAYRSQTSGLHVFKMCDG